MGEICEDRDSPGMKLNYDFLLGVCSCLSKFGKACDQAAGRHIKIQLRSMVLYIS